MTPSAEVLKGLKRHMYCLRQMEQAIRSAEDANDADALNEACRDMASKFFNLSVSQHDLKVIDAYLAAQETT